MSTLIGIVCIILFFILCLLIYQIQSIKKQLDLIGKEEKTNKIVSLNFPGLFIDKMVVEINNIIKKFGEEQEELEYEKTRLKSQITSISHDLRTPLTSIMGYLELLKNAKEEERDEYLNIIKKKSETLQKLVEDFYEVSLVEDKNYELEMSEISPSYILEDVAMEYFNEIEKLGIKLDIKIEEDKKIFANYNALFRVYSNLFSNIKKHGETSAEVYHGIKNDKLVTVFKNKIKENSNIEEGKLFEKFYTGEKSRTRSNSGIGMYTSKVLLEKMNHDIKASISQGYMIIIIEYKD